MPIISGGKIIEGAQFRSGAATTAAGVSVAPPQVFTHAGVPTTEYNNIAAKGALLVDMTNAKLYINTGTLASNTWTVVGAQT